MTRSLMPNDVELSNKAKGLTSVLPPAGETLCNMFYVSHCAYSKAGIHIRLPPELQPRPRPTRSERERHQAQGPGQEQGGGRRQQRLCIYLRRVRRDVMAPLCPLASFSTRAIRKCYETVREAAFHLYCSAPLRSPLTSGISLLENQTRIGLTFELLLGRFDCFGEFFQKFVSFQTPPLKRRSSLKPAHCSPPPPYLTGLICHCSVVSSGCSRPTANLSPQPCNMAKGLQAL